MMWLWIVIPVLVFLWLGWTYNKRHVNDRAGPSGQSDHLGPGPGLGGGGGPG